MFSLQTFRFAFFALCCVIASPFQLHAASDIVPPADVPLTDRRPEVIRLTPDKSEILILERDAISVVVGNPVHLGLVLDTPRSAILIPKQPGTSQFAILDAENNVIIERQVVVAAPQTDYVRIRRACANADFACRPTTMFLCRDADMCHEIAVPEDVDPGKIAQTPDIVPQNPARPRAPAPVTPPALPSDTGLPTGSENENVN